MVVLPFCVHGSLETLLEQLGGCFHLDAKLHMCHHVASGLAYLSAQRIIHRDVASRNVLVDERFHCRVCDFGVRTAQIQMQCPPIATSVPSSFPFACFGRRWRGI